jgi:hypothetical protein
MPGIATQFQILELTIKQLEVSGDPKLEAIASAMTSEPAYAHLGVIGPVLADFLPSGPAKDPQDDPNPFAFVWKNIFGVLGGDVDRFPGSGPGLHHALARLRLILDTMDQIAANEDCDKLTQIRDGTFPDFKLNEIDETAKDFAKLVGDLDPSTSPTISRIVNAIMTGLRPKVDTANPTDPVPPPETWHAREFMHWKGPDRFIASLLDKATNMEKKDPRLLAYAYGYVTGYAGLVCGAPFINSCVGGPARTQWWRQRFTKNFVDSWVHGFYSQTPRPVPSDTPVPPYPEWPDLCAADLQLKIAPLGPDQAPMDPALLLLLVKQNKDFPPGVLPQDFAELWFDAFQKAYPGPHPPGITADDLNAAYHMTWLMLWFQTSGEIIGCKLDKPVEPPDGCGLDPTELDPFKPAPGGGPSLPPTFDKDLEDDDAEVCGILLAILGGVLLLFGGAAGGAVAIAGAAATLDCSNVVHWEKLRCQLFWYRTYIFNGLKGMNELLALAALGYPYTDMLAEDEIVSQVLLSVPFESGRNLVKSRGTDQAFPSKPWDGSLFTFNQRPTSAIPGFEQPSTEAYRTIAYPSFFIDDDVANPLSNGDVKTAGAFPFRTKGGRPVQFGNAVANAVDLFKVLGSDLPSWNLDGDRSLAHLTWEFNGVYDPDAVSIKPEP